MLRTGMVGDTITTGGILWQPNNSATAGMATSLEWTLRDAWLA